MKKAFTIITLAAIILIIFGAYFGIYGVEIPKDYLIVSESLKNTLTIILLSCVTAHAAALLPGILLGKCGCKTVKIVSAALGCVSVAAPFLVSGIAILIFGNSMPVVVASVAVPLFAISLEGVGNSVAQIKERGFCAHKLSLGGARYFKNYTIPFFIKPYFAKFAKLFRTATYTVILLGILNIIDTDTIGALIRYEDTGISGIAVIVGVIFVLLIQILCFLTKQKEEYVK